jgi:hypothetical protein
MWGTSLPSIPPESAGWRLQTIVTYDSIENAFSEGWDTISPKGQGWSFVWQTDSAYLVTRSVPSPKDNWPPWLRAAVDNADNAR